MAGTTPETSSHEHFQHAPDQGILERELSKGLTGIEKYSTQIVIAVLVVAIGAVGFILWQRNQASQQAAGWNSFAECRAPEDFVALAEKYPNAPIGDWSRLQAARLFASEGLSQAMSNRTASDASLKNAKDAYDALLKKSAVIPEVRQEALYGMATCLEALSNGETTPAVEAYETLLKEFPQSPHRLWAESRIKELKTGNAKDFYAWFRAQNPKPADRTGPNDIPSLKNLIPDLDIHGDMGNAAPKDGPQAPSVPEEAPAKEAMPAQPAAEFPAEATPAATENKGPAANPVLPPAKPGESNDPPPAAPVGTPPAMPAAADKVESPKAEAAKTEAPKVEETKPAEPATPAPETKPAEDAK